MVALPAIAQNMERVINAFDNCDREGLKETPMRYAKFLNEFLNSNKEFKFTTFDAEGYDQMIIEKNIKFYSLCEHHLAPFFGTAAIAYIPNKKIVGISKLARTLDYYARNFQNQERITKQVAERLMNELDAKGVAVVLSATHLCMSMRGVNKPDAITTTSEVLGIFRTDEKARNEFLTLIK